METVELKTRLHYGVEMLYRPGTHDQYVFGEAGGYVKVPIRDTDVVLDVGAHIGAFTVLAAKSGAKKVMAYEPQKDSFALLKKNTAKLPNVHKYNIALLGSADTRQLIEFYLQGTNTSGHSIHAFRGRKVVQVPAMRISDVWQGVTYLKLDCEGSEYDILLESKPLPKSVRCVTMEIHFGKRQWKENAKLLDARMLEQGFRHIHAPNLENPSLWHTNATYQRGK